eukprot:6919958-Alexandrium_andersonii.AAC.2
MKALTLQQLTASPEGTLQGFIGGPTPSLLDAQPHPIVDHHHLDPRPPGKGHPRLGPLVVGQHLGVLPEHSQMSAHAVVDCIQVAHHHARVAGGNRRAAGQLASGARLATPELARRLRALEVTERGAKRESVRGRPRQGRSECREHVLNVVGKGPNDVAGRNLQLGQQRGLGQQATRAVQVKLARIAPPPVGHNA